jgi:hypothetical protein
MHGAGILVDAGAAQRSRFGRPTTDGKSYTDGESAKGELS